MGKVFRRKKLFVFFFCFSVTLRGQEVLLTQGVQTAIRKNCPVCSRPSFAYYNPLRLKSPLDIADICYHNCHTALSTGKPADALRYAELTLTTLADSLRHPLYSHTVFLQAKINQRTDSLPAAISRYRYFLSFDTIEAVLAADAHVSLIQAYLKRQEWNEMETYLNAWSQQYSSLSDSAATTSLYENLLSIFSTGKPVRNPEASIEIITAFFSGRSDTARLLTFYDQAGSWYAQQAAYASAVVYLEKGLELALAIRNLKAQQQLYLSLSLTEENRGNFQAALRYRKLYEKTGPPAVAGTGSLVGDQEQKKSPAGIRMRERIKNRSRITG